MTASSDQDSPSDPVLPRHIAVVMDGNGRWARARGLPRSAGHRAGVKAARRIVEVCGELGVGALTLFAFSSENWMRPGKEVRLLMNLFVEVLQREVGELHANNVRMEFIGDRSTLAPKLQRQMESSEQLTANNTGLHLIVAVAYGGRWDLVNATRRIASEAADGRLDPAAIDEQALRSHTALGDLPDPDLFIRTGGERRISNFLIWNLAYSELYFTDMYWPEFDRAALDKALIFYNSRQRRYGRTAEQVEEAG